MGFSLAVATLVLGAPLPWIVAAVVVPIGLIVPILYSTTFSKRTSWLSYGERLMGRVATPTGKIWTNPLGRNRWAPILVWFGTLVLEGNRWDGVYERSYPFGSLIAGAVFTTFVFGSVLRWGQGHRGGAWGVLMYQFFVTMSCAVQVYSDSVRLTPAPRRVFS